MSVYLRAKEEVETAKLVAKDTVMRCAFAGKSGGFEVVLIEGAAIPFDVSSLAGGRLMTSEEGGAAHPFNDDGEGGFCFVVQLSILRR